jgi:hypothetical protein
MTEAQRIISRARTLMALGKAKSWSHAIAIAADSVKKIEK